MASTAQSQFFYKLLDERDFGDSDTKKLKEQFDGLDDTSASAWIERALELDKKPAGARDTTPPPF